MARTKDAVGATSFYTVKNVHDAFNELLTPIETLKFKLGVS